MKAPGTPVMPARRAAADTTIVHIVSEAFQGKNLLQRHRMVYDALGDMLHAEIHALGIQAKTPQELPNSNPTKGNA